MIMRFLQLLLIAFIVVKADDNKLLSMTSSIVDNNYYLEKSTTTTTLYTNRIDQIEYPNQSLLLIGSSSVVVPSYTGSLLSEGTFLDVATTTTSQNAFLELIRLGDYLFRHKAPLQAVSIYESAFRIRAITFGPYEYEHSTPVDAFIMYGLALESLHDEEQLHKAIQVLEEGKKYYPNNRLIHYNLGVYYSMVDEAEKALLEYNTILDTSPLDADVLYNRALVLLHMGDYNAAATSLEDTLPNRRGIWYEAMPIIIRKYETLLANIPAYGSRIRHLQDFTRKAVAVPLLQQQDNNNALILEFGVADGSSIATIAKEVVKYNSNQVIHGFDSFIGLPEKWANDNIGEYSQDGIPPKDVTPENNVQFHIGWFNDTLPLFLDQNPNIPVVGIHIDADLYTSTIEVLELLITRIIPGCVIRFDEYYLLRGTIDSINNFDQYEARAWNEISNKYNIKSVPYSWHGQSVAFTVLENPAYNYYNTLSSAWGW